MINIPITLQSDENGYFDRECPNENCLYQFKIKLKDWEEKLEDMEDAYYSQFTAMEKALAKLQSQQTSLSSLFSS